MSEQSIAGLIAESRKVALDLEVFLGGLDGMTACTETEDNRFIDEGTIVVADYESQFATLRRAADALEKLLTADETRVRDISRLTIERDTARDELAAAKGVLRNHVINHWYKCSGGKPHKCSCDACNGEWLPNEPEKHVGDCAAALQPKVETP